MAITEELPQAQPAFPTRKELLGHREAETRSAGLYTVWLTLKSQEETVTGPEGSGWTQISAERGTQMEVLDR